jgi:hypothetical protein
MRRVFSDRWGRKLGGCVCFQVKVCGVKFWRRATVRGWLGVIQWGLGMCGVGDRLFHAVRRRVVDVNMANRCLNW